MKLRIEDDTLRLRLSESEVRDFAQKGRVAAVIRFGTGPQQQMTYALERTSEASAAATVQVRFDATGLTVLVPNAVATTWANTEQNGFSENLSLAEAQHLRVLVEKDLDCRH